MDTLAQDLILNMKAWSVVMQECAMRVVMTDQNRRLSTVCLFVLSLHFRLWEKHRDRGWGLALFVAKHVLRHCTLNVYGFESPSIADIQLLSMRWHRLEVTEFPEGRW